MARIRLVRRWFSKAWAFFRDPQVAVWKKALGFLAILYVLSPIDLIPDFVPVIGWLDDLGVLALVGSWLAAQVERHAVRDTHDGLPRPLENERDRDASAGGSAPLRGRV